MMADEKSQKEKTKEIVALLPRENCGKCGFQNCGSFALAAVAGEVSLFSCRKNPSAGYQISKILGIEVPERVKVRADSPESHRHGKHRGNGHRSGHHDHRHGHAKSDRKLRHSGGHHSILRGHTIRKILRHLV